VQLRTARLCLDCEEIHEAQQCPICASETFAYISRWVTAPERRARKRSTEPAPDADTYKQLVDPQSNRPTAMRVIKGGAVGIAAITLARWLWRQRNTPES
jgi:hypothetical protein